jgi:hypothetical protein
MNEQLLKFIELCLIDGVISEKERLVIFRKANDLGVPDDECEIILNGMIHKFNSPQKVKDNLVQSENYLDDSSIKSWFKNWIKNDKEIKQTILNADELLRKSFIEYLNSPEDKKNRPDPIQKNIVLELCELKHVEPIYASFFKDGVPGKNGFVENYYKKEILNSLEAEGFISFITSNVSNSFSVKVNIPWKEFDVRQMIENYYYPERKLDGKWFDLVHNLYSIFIGRDSILITEKSIIELHEGIGKDNNEFKKTNFDNINFKTFTDEFNNFKQSLKEIKGFLKSDYLNISHLKPTEITHDNFIFNSVVEKIGINEQTRRIINVDFKIKEFFNSNYNNQIGKLIDKDLFVYIIKEEKSPAGFQYNKLKLNSILGDLNTLSLQLFEIYLKLLKFRDGVLNLYLNNKIIDLEGVLSTFENSHLNLSNFEKESLSKLDSINQNLVELKIITSEGFDNISNDFKETIEKLDSNNIYNEEILSSLNFNNFMSVVSAYQKHNINKSLKSK